MRLNAPDPYVPILSPPAARGLSQDFWLSHAIWPAWAFLAVFMVVEGLGLDQPLARGLYFDPMSGWLGAGSGAWLAKDVLHTGGRWFVRAVAAAALVAWLASWFLARARAWRADAGFVFLAMLSAISIVGVLKSVTNVDCPWDLAGFGGDRPYVPLFAFRPGYLPHAACFPGAHASSGFALLCFYFVFRDHRPELARLLLITGIAAGTAFSMGQEARGAHFFSHDLASASLVWFVQLGLYVGLRRARAS